MKRIIFTTILTFIAIFSFSQNWSKEKDLINADGMRYTGGSLTYKSKFIDVVGDYGIYWYEFTNTYNRNVEFTLIFAHGKSKDVAPVLFGDFSKCQTFNASGKVTVQSGYSFKFKVGIPVDLAVKGHSFLPLAKNFKFTNTSVSDVSILAGAVIAGALIFSAITSDDDNSSSSSYSNSSSSHKKSVSVKIGNRSKYRLKIRVNKGEYSSDTFYLNPNTYKYDDVYIGNNIEIEYPDELGIWYPGHQSKKILKLLCYNYYKCGSRKTIRVGKIII